MASESIPLHKKCLICSGDEFSSLQESWQHPHLVKCCNCGFIFFQRIPTETELEKHYGGYPRNNALSEITVKRYNELLDKFEPYRKTGRLLDVGCGDGHFLAVAAKRGWKVYGTEFTDEAVQTGTKNGAQVFKGRIQDFNLADDFDVITSFEVLEHICDLKEHTARINSLLRKGGLFYFTTPNINALSRRILGGKWTIIEYPEHLSYYTVKTIHLLLAQTGLRKISIQTTGISLQRFSASVKQSAPTAGKDEQARQTIEKNVLLRFVKAAINALLNLLNLGDTLKGFYVKA
ncbi:MAG: Ubiquinone biosynthesis O-methyltransferase [Bacteroidota bacterium]|jgi:2-polyprenyl-3-methyl-5-hydroxy-6-metoxy-1,4-benzoquinol methylase